MECQHCGGALPKPKRGQRQKFCTARCRVAANRQSLCVTNGERTVAVGEDLPGLPEVQLEASRPALGHSPAVTRADRLGQNEFRWRGLALHFGKRKRPVLTLVADDIYPHLFRIRYPDGWTSTAANISRAKDAAYGHARWLLSGGAQ